MTQPRKVPVRVLIVDDHPTTRLGFRMLLQGLDPTIGVAEAGSVGAALALARETFELVLLDMQLPDVSDLEALQRVREGFGTAAIAVVSAKEQPDFIRKTINAGAAGYIPKTTDGEVIGGALKLILARGVYLPPQALNSEIPLVIPAPAQPQVRLTPKQLAVLQRLLQAKPNKVICTELAMAEGTVRAHVTAVYAALGLSEDFRVNKRAAVMERAYQLGLIDQLPKLGSELDSRAEPAG